MSLPLVLGAVASSLPSILDRVLPGDSEDVKLEKLKVEVKIRELLASENQAQTQVNIEEAKNPKLFIAGWRPFTGWICGLGLAISAVKPLLDCILVNCELQPMPEFDTSELVAILLGLLGLGGLRTYEKMKGIK